jgi:hypothetical protein
VQVHDSPASADSQPQPPPPTASAAKPYLSMLRHLRGSSYDSPNLGPNQLQRQDSGDSVAGSRGTSAAAAAGGDSEVDSPVTPKTQTLTAGGRAAAHSPGSSGGFSATQQDSPASAERAGAAGGLQAEGEMQVPTSAPAEPDSPAAADDQPSNAPTVVIAEEAAAASHPASAAAIGLAGQAANTPAAMVSKPTGPNKCCWFCGTNHPCMLVHACCLHTAEASDHPLWLQLQFLDPNHDSLSCRA